MKLPRLSRLLIGTVYGQLGRMRTADDTVVDLTQPLDEVRGAGLLGDVDAAAAGETDRRPTSSR